jgi:hypothetical protein
MNKQIISFISIIFLTLILGILLVSCGTSTVTPHTSGGNSLDGQTLMQQRCSICHPLGRVTSAHKSIAQWTQTTQRMIAHGARLNTQEEQALIVYLAANYK